jgi:hypothetical protein
MKLKACLLLTSLQIAFSAFSQDYRISDEYLLIQARQNDPVYTTYAAAPERSRLYGDKAYKMVYDDDYEPIYYGSEHGGRFFCIWEINQVVVGRTGEFHIKPSVRASFPDMAILNYEPWPGLGVEEIFFVFSSQIALTEMIMTNTSSQNIDVNLYPVFDAADSLKILETDRKTNRIDLQHHETKKRLISNLSEKYPYSTGFFDIFTASFPYYSHGGYPGTMKDFYNIIKTDYYSENRSDTLNNKESGPVDFIALHGKFNLRPGEKVRLRYFRGIVTPADARDSLAKEISTLASTPIQPFIDKNVSLFENIPRLDFPDRNRRMIYLSAFNLARGCMLPPEGEARRNYYVFSREPVWGWGHGHQVLHESLSMLAYAWLDPVSSQNSQRIYMDQQGDDGLIAYRHGPRGPQTYPHKGQPTTSAPFYNWINLEVYKASGDREFLGDAYESGVRYALWLVSNRDSDHDGTFEWGPYGIIENVRDWYNAVFQVSKDRYLDVDKEDISDELECLDLSLMMVKEFRSLSEMAKELGKEKESRHWSAKADELSERINDRMWDEQSGFFYSVNKSDHGFMFMTRDLRRQEIIGFLPLWAGAVSKERADILIETLTDTTKFWRKYGIPTLAADDPWYSPDVDYCCKWNGPVWMLWNYMVFDGLVSYGYHDLAGQLGERMIAAAELQLRKNHNFWESYSPDNEVLNCPSNYIWDAILARLLIDLDRIKNQDMNGPH